PLRTSRPNFGNPRLAGVLWATARDAVRNIFLAFSALNPLKNQTLSQHRIQRDGRPNELGYGGDVFWFNAMCAFLSSIQHLGSSIASYWRERGDDFQTADRRGAVAFKPTCGVP